MTTLAAALRSSVGKKYLMGLSGLVWFGFAVGHLIGNYLLFAGRKAFNEYASFLEEFGHGKALYVVEAALLLVLITHVWNGIQVAYFDKGNARPQGYAKSGDAGGASRKTLASQTMIYTGLLLLVFFVIHLWSFKFGNKIDPAHVDKGSDLYYLVVQRFADPVYTGVYVICMLALGFHLSHGLWSSLQSLGVLNRRTYPVAATAAVVVAALLAIGFIALPLTVCAMNTKFAEGNGGLL